MYFQVASYSDPSNPAPSKRPPASILVIKLDLLRPKMRNGRAESREGRESGWPDEENVQKSTT